MFSCEVFLFSLLTCETAGFVGRFGTPDMFVRLLPGVCVSLGLDEEECFLSLDGGSFGGCDKRLLSARQII